MAEAPRIAFNGGDVAGPTDAPEVPARAGLRTVLCTGVPSAVVPAPGSTLDGCEAVPKGKQLVGPGRFPRARDGGA